jgi:hypothetical protein
VGKTSARWLFSRRKVRSEERGGGGGRPSSPGVSVLILISSSIVGLARLARRGRRLVNSSLIVSVSGRGRERGTGALGVPPSPLVAAPRSRASRCDPDVVPRVAIEIGDAAPVALPLAASAPGLAPEAARVATITPIPPPSRC